MVTMETKLPKTLAELAAMDKLPRGAFVQSGQQMFRVDSVRKLADEVYTINGDNQTLFNGFESVMVYFDVRSFAEVIREILNHRFAELYKVATPEQLRTAGFAGDLFVKAQQEIVTLRKRLERAYGSEVQKSNTLEVWKFGIAAYQAYVIDHQRFADIVSMSLSKLARKASDIGQTIDAKAAKEGEVAYYWQKR